MTPSHGNTWYPDSPDGAADKPAPDVPDRYRVLGLLGAGGMGEVWRVEDTRLERTVAMKVVRGDLSSRPRLVERFEEEARLCAGLQHPAIVPVHDLGVTRDGRLWFTMRELRGETLRRYLERVHAASTDDTWGADDEGWTLRRLLSCFEQVCEAVAYAHARGVVHRDLKPDNIMVGAFGEVQVLDWGVATLVQEDEAPRRGSVGTPAFMSPEQARGRAYLQGPKTDIYALGATLYVLLTGHKPYHRTKPSEVLLEVISGPPPSVRRAHGRPIAPELVELVERCMARSPDDRPDTVHEIARSVREHLDGLRRADAARDRMDEVRPLADLAHELRRRALRLRRDAEAQLAPLPPHAPVTEKRTAWALEDRAAELEADAALQEARFVQGLHEALQLAELPEAHRLLAEHHKAALVDAESRGDRRAATAAELRLRAHDRGQHASFLDGVTELRLRTDPPGARWLVERLVEQDRVLVGRSANVDRGSDGALLLPRGRWRLRSRLAGHAEVVLPVHARRGVPWEDTRPDGTPLVVRLPREGELPADSCYVPAGWFLAGGEDDAYDPLPARRLFADGFVVARDPVTVGQYLAFLGSLRVAHGDDSAEACTPNGPEGHRLAIPDGGSGYTWHAPDELDHPVTWISWHDAMAYAAWLAARTGHPWRLLHSLEWEKAARGVDGRRYPWGERADPTFALVRQSRDGQPLTAPVDAHPQDVSPYGVRGLGGNVRELCLDGYTKEHPEGDHVRPVAGTGTYRMMKGSCFADTRTLPVSTRLVVDPDQVNQLRGFRLGFSWG